MEITDKPTVHNVEWIKCQSKSRPGHFYLFNKSTGETKWCTSSSDNEREMEATRAKRQRPISEPIKKEQEPPPNLSALRTPAQDRLKRLQHKLKKDGIKKVLTESKNKNSNGGRNKNINNNNNERIKNKEADSKKIKKLESLSDGSCRTSEKSKSKYEEVLNSATNAIPMKTPTKIAKKRTISPERVKIQSEDADSTPAKTLKITKDKLNQEESMGNQPSTTSRLGGLIFNKIKSVCKSTLNIAKKSSSTLKNSTNKNEEIEQMNVEPTSAIEKGVVLHTAKSEPSTPKNLMIPSYERGSANSRLNRLRMSLSMQPSTSIQCSSRLVPVTPTVSIASDNKSINSSILSDDYEPMDWQEAEVSEKNESIEASISKSSSLNSSCNINSKPDTSTTSEYYEAVNENLLRLSAEKQKNSKNPKTQWLRDHYYFVIDTNVLLEYITFIDELTEMKLVDTKGTIIYVPYCVLQELDKLKIRAKKESVQLLAARAIKYLNSQFEAKNSNIRAQSAFDERDHLIDITSPDDSILNCCLQVQQHVENVILLSEDVNLRNKARCNNLIASTKSDLLTFPAPSSTPKDWSVNT